MVDIFFLCNKKACPNCSYPECKHTEKSKYAKNDICGSTAFEPIYRKGEMIALFEKEDSRKQHIPL